MLIGVRWLAPIVLCACGSAAAPPPAEPAPEVAERAPPPAQASSSYPDMGSDELELVIAAERLQRDVCACTDPRCVTPLNQRFQDLNGRARNVSFNTRLYGRASTAMQVCARGARALDDACACTDQGCYDSVLADLERSLGDLDEDDRAAARPDELRYRRAIERCEPTRGP